MDKYHHPAPGGPGQFSPWTSGAKTGVGRAQNSGAEISFTLGKGVLNEVYFPREDTACIRECGLVVTDGAGFFSDERRQTRQKGRMGWAGVPAYELDNRCCNGRYRIRKEIITDPRRDTVLQRIRWEPSGKDGNLLSLYVYLTPHLHNSGQENTAWLADHKGTAMLFAMGDGLSLALACSTGWTSRTVGYIGASDGLTDVRSNGRLTEQYDYAGKGHVQLCAAPDLAVGEKGEFVLAIGFGHTPADAAHQAWSSLLDGFDAAKEQYVREWKKWHRQLWAKRKGRPLKGRYLKESAAALAISESRQYPGGIIASLAVPWGDVKGVNDGLGYHLVWPRDLVESAWGFLALGAKEDALRILNYLFATQDGDGKWAQNLWLDGRPDLTALQMDQVALPLLLLDSCHRRGLLDKGRWQRYWPGVQQAVEFILDHGPMTQQDRWEQQPGLSPFTLATEIAALLVAAGWYEEVGNRAQAQRCRSVADDWNRQIEEWTYVRGTETAHRYGVEGYYIRINPHLAPLQEVKDRSIIIRHRNGDGEISIGEVLSPDALALVRFGLRRPDDQRILNTIRVIDGELKQELPAGPCWRRFTKDAYGEDDTGHRLENGGRGRSWPLLTGERAHYELAAGNRRRAKQLFRAMEGLSHQGLLPEQVWDGGDLPAMGLYRGRFTGSAMPLTWAQAEYIKLAVSIREGKIFDTPVHTRDRYL